MIESISIIAAEWRAITFSTGLTVKLTNMIAADLGSLSPSLKQLYYNIEGTFLVVSFSGQFMKGNHFPCVASDSAQTVEHPRERDTIGLPTGFSLLVPKYVQAAEKYY